MPTAVRREQAQSVRQALDAGPATTRPGKTATLTKYQERAAPASTQRTWSGNAREPALTNLHKVYWPDEGYTKGDLIAYYREVSSFLLPYLRDRPEALNRHPNGILGKNFFQKDVSNQVLPDWVQTTTIASGSGVKHITYVLCQDEPTLLYLANLGCIELNPWNSRVGALDRPDYLIIDLDPVETPFVRVVEAAVAVHRTLDRAGAANICKTSGKRGLHVFVPLGGRYDTDLARRFADLVANLVQRLLPGFTSVLRSPALRQGRVYLDFLQNRRGQTLAAPYSVRPFPGATVSTPLKWQEVKKGLDPARFTIKTLPRRLAAVGDLWQPVLGPAWTWRIASSDCRWSPAGSTSRRACQPGLRTGARNGV